MTDEQRKLIKLIQRTKAGKYHSQTETKIHKPIIPINSEAK